MGFIFNDITSGSMGIKARLTSWQVCGKMRNFTTTVPGKYGVADFGADFDYREITVHCNIYPKRKLCGVDLCNAFGTQRAVFYALHFR